MSRARHWKIVVAVERNVVARDKDNAERIAQEFAYEIDDMCNHRGYLDAETKPLRTQPIK